jgi:hypothetical protein
MPVSPSKAISAVTTEELYPPVDVKLMRLAWTRYKAGLQSPAQTEERRIQRAVSRVRNAVREDWRHQWAYVFRCDAFRKLILEIGIDGFGKYLQPSDEPGNMVFHNAVLEAVATVPIRDRDGRFGRIEFLAAVNKIAGNA